MGLLLLLLLLLRQRLLPCLYAHCCPALPTSSRLPLALLAPGVKRLYDLVNCKNEQHRIAFYYAMRDTVVAQVGALPYQTASPAWGCAQVCCPWLALDPLLSCWLPPACCPQDLEQASRIAYGQDRRWRRVVTLKVCCGRGAVGGAGACSPP